MDYSPGVVDNGPVQTELEAISRAIMTPTGFFELTAGEETANISPLNYRYPPGDVRRYGAKVDGSTDDSSPLQAALLCGTEAYAPPGTLSFSGSMELVSRSRLAGAGKALTRLAYTGSAQAFKNTSPGTSIEDIAIRNLSLRDDGTGTIGLDLDSVKSGDFYGLQINSFGKGVRINSPTSGNSVYSRFYDVTTTSCTTGFELDGTSSNAHTFTACRTNVCTTGFALEDCNDNTLLMCQIEGGTTGVAMTATGAGLNVHNVVQNCRFEGVTTNISIGTNVTESYLIGNYHVNGTPLVDNGTRTNVFFPGGAIIVQKLASALPGATGDAWTFERTANGGSNAVCLRVVDSATTSGTPTTLQVETGRTTGHAIRVLNGVAGSESFGVLASGRIRTNQTASNTNTPGGATAYQLPLYDQTGTLLGYIPVYGSAW
jgi:hypothetical protein